MSLQAKQLKTDEMNEIAADSTSKEFENFIYLVSHDVRNSVRALLEVPQWIEEDLETAGINVSGPLADNISLMNTHTRRLDRMLIDLLVYSRIGRLQSDSEVLWDDVIDTLMDQIQIPTGFRIVRDIRVPSVKMGENDVMTLMSSLITNSIKHGDRNNGTMTIRITQDNGGTVLTVSDDGPGIPMKFREKAFEVMTTLRPRDEVEGSGMGLANVRKIASLYGASIEWPDTSENGGFALSLLFPAAGTN